MVVAEGPNDYILYSQNDHGDLAGQFWPPAPFIQRQPGRKNGGTLRRNF
jgi:hypothetical protein